MLGMGNLPCSATEVAAIRPKVMAGNKTSAMTLPITGIMEASDTQAMNKKNSPDMAKGCFQKVRIPWRTQTKPMRAGTMVSFIQDNSKWFSKQNSVCHALSHNTFKMVGIMGLEHGSFSWQMKIP